jgi:biopolymer transport protein ExbB
MTESFHFAFASHVPLWLAQDPGQSGTLLRFITGGGVIGYIIIALSIGAMAMAVIHFMQIRRKALIPPEQVDVLDSMLARGDAVGALEYTITPDNDSYLTRILSAGLTRYQKSAFGAFEIQTAIEEAGEEQTARLYRSTDVLGLIGAIAPLLGLLGTVQGMIGAFETVSQSAVNDANYYENLAYNISIALITTFQGLVVAIPCVALYTYFRNRIDAFASEAASEIERLVLHLESSNPSLPTSARGPVAAAGGPRPAAPVATPGIGMAGPGGRP